MLLPILTNADDLRGKRVLLRLDLNLPVKDGAVTDAYRALRVSRTLQFLRESGACTLIISHIESKETTSLRPVFDALARQMPIAFAATIEEAREKLRTAPNGSFLLLENLRIWKGEKENSSAFAGELAALADIYVNEAFSASHRAHASIVGVPDMLPHYAGFLFEEEVTRLSKALSPPHPALVILGGAKFETKLPLIERFRGIADIIYVCGALANDIYRARGYETGVSLISDSTISSTLLQNPNIQVPSDVIVRTPSGNSEKGADALLKGEKIVDAGGDAIADLRALIEKAKFVLWNGPLGEYEAGFDAGTVAAAQLLAESDAETIVGGGDSLAVVGKLGLLERFSFVSTGGGAMLEFLATGTLPGIEALLHNKLLHNKR